MQETNVTGRTKVQPLWFTVLRVIVGFVLLWKGILFIRDTALLEQLIDRTGIGAFSQNSRVISFIVSYLSLLCGLFIATGLWTKASAIVQIPILIVAVFFVNIGRVENSNLELVLSIVTLLLLIFFAIKGSGTLSADEFFRTYYRAGSEDGQTKQFFKQ
ncbi:MAG: DoxX family membrane protein [Ginsengibacter sp.]